MTDFYEEYNDIIQQYKGLTYEEMASKLGTWYASKQAEFSLKDEKIYWMLSNAMTYYNEYPLYLSEIQARAAEMNTVSIFSQPNSFSSKNIEKTANDYKKLEGVNLEIVNGDAVMSFLSYQLGNYIVLIMIMVVAYQLLAERKKGLWDIVHSTRNGRFRLAVKRCFVLFGIAVALCSFVYGVNLVLAFWIYGGKEVLHCNVQSIATFRYCDLNITVLEFIGFFLFIKCGSIFLIGALIWVILSAISSLSIGMLSFGLFLGIEYSFFYFLPVQSILNLLKYVNIFSFIDLSEVFITYLNVNIFSKPIAARDIILWMLPGLIVLSTAGCIVVNARKKPKESSTFSFKLTELLQWISNILLSHLRVAQLELYKILFVKKGIVILLLFWIYQSNAIVSGEVFWGKEELYFKSYVERIEGPLEDKTFEKMDEIKSTIEAEEAQLAELEQQLEKGIITKDEYIIQFNYNGFERLEYKQTAYSRLEEKVQRVEATEEQIEANLWIISEYGYDYLLGKESYQKHNITALLVLFIVVMILSSVFVYEKQNQTSMLLRSMREGRAYLYRRKEFAGICIVVCVFLIGNSTELITTSNLYGLKNLNVPIQSLEILKDFPIVMSIGQFLLLLYSIRVVMLVCCMYVVYLISMLVNKEEQSTLINIVILLIPSVIYTIGISGFKGLAISNQISAISNVVEISNGMLGVIPMAGFILIAVLARVIGIKLWANEI